MRDGLDLDGVGGGDGVAGADGLGKVVAGVEEQHSDAGAARPATCESTPSDIDAVTANRSPNVSVAQRTISSALEPSRFLAASRARSSRLSVTAASLLPPWLRRAG